MTRDLRKFARQTNVRLIAGALVLLFLLGDGLIYIFYGQGAALMGLLCLLGALTPLVLIVVVMTIIDWIVKHENPD